MLDEEYSGLKICLKNLNAETDRLILRRYRTSDQDGFLKIFGDPYTMEMDGDTVITEKNEEFRRRMEMVESDVLIFLCLEEKASHNFVGYILINQYPAEETGVVTLGFSLVPEYQHRGFGSEAVKELLARLKATEAVDRVLANAYAFNKPSLGLIRKMGFEFLHGDDKDEYYQLDVSKD